MVGINFGTKIVRVNISKIRKDHNPIEDVEVSLDPATLPSADSTVNVGFCETLQTDCETSRADCATRIVKRDSRIVKLA